jgi:hypothetical protein
MGQAATGRPCFTAVEAVTELTVNAGLTAETFSVFSDAVQLFCRAPPRLIQHDKPDRHLVDTVFKALSDRSCDYANELMKMLGQLRRAGVFVSRIPYSSVLQAMLTTNGGDVSKGLGFVMATATTRPKGQPSDFSVPVYCQLIRALLRVRCSLVLVFVHLLFLAHGFRRVVWMMLIWFWMTCSRATSRQISKR